MIELQEANKDVLVGKRNMNCLSCGAKEDQTISQVLHGSDGRVYKAKNTVNNAAN